MLGNCFELVTKYFVKGFCLISHIFLNAVIYGQFNVWWNIFSSAINFVYFGAQIGNNKKG